MSSGLPSGTRRAWIANAASRPLVVAIAIFIATIILGAVFVQANERSRVLEKQKAATALAVSQARALQDHISRSLSATYALAAVLQQGDGTIDDFETLAQRMLALYGGISALQIAPNGIIEKSVPLQGNEKAIGHDLLKDPTRNAEAFLAVRTRALTLAGPFELIQGGSAVVGRLPVFLHDEFGTDRFWGFTTALIRIGDLSNASNLPQLLEAGYHYQLSRIHPDSKVRQVFASSTSSPLHGPVSINVAVPNGEWMLSVAPVDGWNAFWPLLGELAVVLIVSILVSAIAYTLLEQPEVLRDEVEHRTRELALANETLEVEIAERVRMQQNLTHLNRLYALLSETNHAVVRIDDRDELLREICRIAVEHGRLQMAWIGIAEADGRVKPVAYHGGADADVDNVRRVADDRSLWPASSAIGSDILSGNCEGCPQDGKMVCCIADEERRFRSCAALPLHFEQKRIGALNLYSRESNFFDASQIAVLKEIADDLSYALDHIAREARRIEAEERIRKLSRAVEQSSNAVMITDIHGVIEYVNPKFCEMTGYAPEEVIGGNPRILKSAELPRETYSEMWAALLSGKEWGGEFHNRRKDGELYWCLETISPLKNDAMEVTHFVSVQEDISSRKLAESTIRQLANYDALTNLPNRRLFSSRLAQAAASARRSNHSLALLYFDPDRLKTINDTLGHAAGDELLRRMAERIGERLRDSDTLARLHGDLFAVLIPNISAVGDAARIAESIVHAMRQPFRIGGHELFMTASVGISIYPSDTSDLELLHQHADTALHRAKQRGSSDFQFFTADMNAAMVQRLSLENSLRRAIEREEFELLFQPQVDLRKDRISGCEVLLRWRSPEHGLIGPGRFIALAEETGLIVPIGDWVIRKACAQAVELARQGLRPVRFAINVSARQFGEGRLVDTVTSALDQTGLSPDMLELELTEGVIMDRTEQTIDTLLELNAMGIHVSIDDFGTGYSSLSYLKRLPVQVLKIDQSFVRDISSDPDDRAIVTAIVALAHSLKLRVVAEGVETREQLMFLRSVSCDHMQGYYFSQPVNAHDFRALLRQDTAALSG